MPLFSIIIPTYNRRELLKRAIDSVLSQTIADFEIIVVDDGSTDNTLELKNQYPDVIFLHQKNQGVSVARNRGIEYCNGRYVCFLDSDDLWLPEKLANHKFFIENNPYMKIHQTQEIWMRNSKRVNSPKKLEKKSGDIFSLSLLNCMITPSSVAIEKSIFNKYGIFDEKLKACEDYDLWLRITQEEQIGLIDKNLIVRYGGHTDQLSHQFPAMDIFRIYSMLKLIEQTRLTREQSLEIKKVLLKKCKVIKQGAEKRDNQKLFLFMESSLQKIISEEYSSIDYHYLLQIRNSL